MATTLLILSIGLPWLGGLCVWLLGDNRPDFQHRLASLWSAAGGLLSLGLLFFISSAPAVSINIGGVFGEFTLIPDGLGVYLAIIASVIGSFAVIFSNDYMKGEAQLGRYYALVLLFIGAMCGLVLSGSMLFMFIFWEITAFCSYALISFHNDDPKAVAGGIKALIMTQIGGIGLLVGAILSYAYSGSYQIDHFLATSSSLPQTILAVTAFGFLIAAAAKSAQVPFHTWLPDAMEAPTPISALIHAATMVNAGVYLLARFFPAFKPVPGWTTAVVIVGLLSVFLGGIMAVTANDLKRTLAFSTISQLGVMVYAIGIGAVFPSQFHLLSHSVFKALLFLGAGAVIHAVGSRDMREMSGLNRLMPFTRTVFIIGALGLAGIPIANGFFSKELVLEASIESGLTLIVMFILAIAITAFYSARMVSMVFYQDHKAPANVHDAGSAMRTALAPLAFGTLTTWLLAGPFAGMLAASLPHHDLEHITTTEMVIEVFSNPITYLTLIVVAAGVLVWIYRRHLGWLSRALHPVAVLTYHDFGFEWVNKKIINLTQSSASGIQRTQTGYLGWNVVGIISGLVVILAILVWSI